MWRVENGQASGPRLGPRWPTGQRARVALAVTLTCAAFLTVGGAWVLRGVEPLPGRSWIPTGRATHLFWNGVRGGNVGAAIWLMHHGFKNAGRTYLRRLGIRNPDALIAPQNLPQTHLESWSVRVRTERTSWRIGKRKDLT